MFHALAFPARIAKGNRILFMCFLALIVLVSPSFATAAGCDGAGNCYIYAAATGAGNGSSWTNAYTGFGTGTGKINPASMSRGVTYWIATGSYGGVNFSTPDSSTEVITIEGATANSHGPATDWSNSFAGQAVFGESTVSTDYWTFNGQTRGSDWQSGYTIKFWNQTDGGGSTVFIGGNNHLSFSYVEMEGTGMTGGTFPNNTTADRCTTNNCGSYGDSAIYETAPVDTLYVGYGYEHHTGNTQFQMNATGSGGSVNNNTTWEYNWISYNHTGQNGIHDEAYSLYASNVAIRYNVFQDICGSGIITTAGAGAPALSNWDVYGNLFFWDPTYAAYNGKYWLAVVANSVLDFLGEKMSGHVTFTNNTIAGIYNSAMEDNGSAASTIAISGISGYSTCGSTCPTVTIENNLWYSSGYVYGGYPGYCQAVTGATCVQDYNASYQGSVPSGSNWQTNNPPAAHDYNVSGSTANPFANWLANTIAGYEPATPDPFAGHAGTSLASPYNMDMLGVTRGANGTWDRGALQLPSSSQVSLQSIAITPANPSIVVNGTQQFTATGTYNDGTTQDLTGSATWSSSNTGVASILAGGLATGLEAGTSTIQAVSGSASASTILTVTAPTLQSITVTPANASITTGSTQQYTAYGNYSNGTTSNLTGSVTWSSSSTGVATISSSGLANGVAAGSTTIRAVSGSVSGSTTLTVTGSTLQSITVTPASASITTGGTQQYTATGTYSNGTTSNLTGSVTWSSSSTGVATISAGGLASGVAAGSTTIRAVSGSVSGSATLTVTAPTLQSIAVIPASASITTGGTLQYSVTGTYSNGTTSNLTGSVIWSSSNSSVATVSAGGLAVGVAAGSVTIRAVSGSVSGSAALTVTTVAAPTLVSISVTPASFTLAPGGTQQLAATGTYSDGSTQTLTGSTVWSSSNTAAATVSATGLVTGVAAGSATIQAAVGSIAASAQATVTSSSTSSSNLAGWWKFDEGSGTTAADSSGNGNTATLYNGIQWVTGEINDAISANGSKQYVQIPGVNLRSTAAITWTAWVKRTWINGNETLLENSANFNNSTTGFGFFPDDSLDCGTKSVLMTGVHGNVGYSLNCYKQPTSGVWHHLAVVYDKTQRGPNVVTFYVDGVLQTPVKKLYTATNTNNFDLNATYVFSRGGTSQFTAGQMDDLRIYTQALNASQIQQIYQQGLGTLSSITVTPANATISAGGTQQYKATGTYSSGATADLTGLVTWSSSNSSAAAISSSGLATGVAAGSTTIEATLGSASGTTGLTVAAGSTLVSISVTPASFTLTPGGAQQLAATGTYSNGSTTNLTSSVTWGSSATSVATVSSTGLVTGVAAGSATIQAAVGSITGSAQATVTASTGLAGWWKFDEGSGTTAADSSGNGNTATLYNGIQWVTGEINDAISANGSKQYVQIPGVNLRSTAAITWTAWVKRTWTNGTETLLENSANFNNSTTGFGFYPDDSLDCGLPSVLMTGVHGNVGYSLNCYRQPTSGVWHHLAVVYDKTQPGPNVVTFYVDGVLQTPVKNLYTATNTNNFDLNTTYVFSRGGTSQFTAGQMDDLRIYPEALTAAQIQQIYQQSPAASGNTIPTLGPTSGARICISRNAYGACTTESLKSAGVQVQVPAQ